MIRSLLALHGGLLEIKLLKYFWDVLYFLEERSPGSGAAEWAQEFLNTAQTDLQTNIQSNTEAYRQVLTDIQTNIQSNTEV